MSGRTEELMYAVETDAIRRPPPGEFVTHELEQDCARFLEELRRRAVRTEGIDPSSEK